MGDIDQDLEQRIMEIGKPIIEAAKRYKSKIFSEEWRYNAIFNICMADERVKVQLFRFIDVLPSLKTEEEIASHLKEYLSEVNLGALGLGTALIGKGGIESLARRMAKSFIAGADISETYETLNELIKNNMSFTLDIVGEKVTSEVDAEKYMRNYLTVLDFLADKFRTYSLDKYDNPRINISVKISSLYPRFDPIDQEGTSKAVKDRLRIIFRKAREIGAAVNIDTEHYQFKDITYKIFKELLEENEFRDFKHAGIVVQAYLKDSEESLKDLIDWSNTNNHTRGIRLVKGAYWDHEVMLAQRNGWEVPVFTKKWQSDNNFEKLTRILLENSSHIYAAIATHNIRSMAYALALKKELGIDDKNFEIQMLYGMGGEIKRALIEQNTPLRIYAPMGELIPGMGYFVRRLLENSANESFLRAFNKNADPDLLLRNPTEIAETTYTSSKEQSLVGRILALVSKRGRKEQQVDTQQKYQKEKSGFTNFPVYDWSIEKNREAMQQALQNVESNLGKLHYDLNIGGRKINTGEYIESMNPSTSKLIGKVSKANTSHIDDALQAAKEAFKKWQYTSTEERASYLFNVAKQTSERVFELSALIVYEAGKTWKEAYADVAEAIDFLNFYGHEMIRLGKEFLTQNILGEVNTISYAPRGTVAVIPPWNFPLAITTGMTSAAIVAGNAVILKPASNTPLIAGELMNMFEKAGLPAGVLNYVPSSGRDIGDYLVESPLVDMVAFTGSKDVGLRIYEKISNVQKGQENVKTTILEMGGKDGMIIDSTADLDGAIPDVLQSAFGYQGQKCSACSRVIVHESIYDEFINRLVESAKSLKIGEAHLSGTDLGPIINKEAYVKIKNYVRKARQEGGIFLLDGKLSKDKYLNPNGFYIGPTIIEVSRNNIIAKEEVFGPVLAVIKVKDFDEAIEALNDTEYALTGGLYSRTPPHIRKFKKEARVGNRYINRGITGAIVERQPFGGFKMSGAGSKAGGIDYLKHFMYHVTTTENTATKGLVEGLSRYVRTI